MKKVCIVGASGKLGQYMVQHALDQDYEVVGVCRERSVGKLDGFKGRITIFPGATNDRQIIKKAVEGCDEVLTVLVPWGVHQYSSGTAQAVLDHARPDARLIFSCGWHITQDGQDVYSRTFKALVAAFGWLARLLRIAEIDDQVEACKRIFTSKSRWTVVRGSNLEEGESQGLPVWSRHVGDPVLASNITRRVDFALFMATLLPRARIIIGTIKGNVSAANILKDALNATRDLRIRQILLALGPTSPLTLGTRHQKIIWATFLDAADVQNGNDPIVVPPTHLTDLSISFEKLCDKGSVRLLLGDFIDSTLSASNESAVFQFLSKILTRIRENKQTAFFLVSEDMHDAKKVAMVKRFADVVIEYRGIQGDDGYGVETRVLDYARDYYGNWQRNGNSGSDYEERRLLSEWSQEVEIRR